MIEETLVEASPPPTDSRDTATDVAADTANNQDSGPAQGPDNAIPADNELPTASWANSFKHGCSSTGKVLRPADHGDIKGRFEQLCARYHPATPAEEQALETVATAEHLEERCQMICFAMLDEAKAAAEDHWDLNEAVAAQELAQKLPQAPGLVRVQLMQTPQGVEIEIGLWTGLDEALNVSGVWTSDERSLALDLLGVPPRLRAPGRTEVDARPGEDPCAVARAVVQRELKALRDEVRHAARLKLDRLRRSMALNGAPVRVSREFKLMKRYEAMHVRRRKEAMTEFERLREERRQEEQEDQNRFMARLMRMQERSQNKAAEAPAPQKTAPAAAKPAPAAEAKKPAPSSNKPPTSSANGGLNRFREREEKRAKKKAEREARKAARRNRR